MVHKVELGLACCSTVVAEHFLRTAAARQQQSTRVSCTACRACATKPSTLQCFGWGVDSFPSSRQ